MIFTYSLRWTIEPMFAALKWSEGMIDMWMQSVETFHRWLTIVQRLILGFGVLDLASGDQGADQRAEKSLASFARVMNELEEPEVDREFLLRNAAMRPQPGAKQ